jgi:hypothetical protein
MKVRAVTTNTEYGEDEAVTASLNRVAGFHYICHTALVINQEFLLI